MARNLQTNNLHPFRKLNACLRPLSNAVATLMVAGLCMSAEQALAQTAAYVQWPLTSNNQDNAAVRSAGVTAATPVLRRYVLSDGQTPTGATAFAAYSNLGQAFGVAANGGGWSSNATPPGPGSSPRRTYYEQFAITATAPVRVDSLLFNAVVPSSAAGKVSVMYSLSNFTADSSTVTGGKGPTGALPSTADGTFGTGSGTSNAGATIPQYVAGTENTSTFRFALAGANGLTLAMGQTLTVRLYFGVGSSSDGRYILLKNVTLKSKQAAVTAAAIARSKEPLTVYPNPTQDQLLVAHPAAKKGAMVVVYTATGQKAASLAAQPGTTSTDMHLNSLTSGIYLVEYSDGQQRITSKIVKQ